MQRSLGFWRCWALVVGTMIGSGVFMLPATLAPYGEDSLWGWAVASTGTLFIAFSLGALARRLPRAGGPYAYTRHAFGELPGFLVAWGYWVSWWSGVAALAVSFAGYLAALVPAAGASPRIGGIAAAAAIWVFTLVNLRGVRAAGIVQLVTTVLKLLPLLLVAGYGFLRGDAANLEPALPEAAAAGWPAMLATMTMLTMWAYVGFEAATIPADDVIEPSRTIPRALVAGILSATAAYVTATVGIMLLVPAPELAQSSSPFALAGTRLFGEAGGVLVAAGAVISILGSLNANVLAAGQLPHALARDGLLPARFAGENAAGAPAFALLFSSTLATLLIAFNFSGGLVAAFNALILLSTLTTLVPYASSALADLVLSWRDAASDGTRPRRLAVALVALLFSLFAIVGSGAEVIGYGVLLLGAGVPVWLLMRRNGTAARH